MLRSHKAGDPPYNLSSFPNLFNLPILSNLSSLPISACRQAARQEYFQRSDFRSLTTQGEIPVDRHFTLGKLALLLGVQEHQLRQLANRGKVPHSRAGRFRLFKESDLPKIRQACVDAGFLDLSVLEVASV